MSQACSRGKTRSSFSCRCLSVLTVESISNPCVTLLSASGYKKKNKNKKKNLITFVDGCSTVPPHSSGGTADQSRGFHPICSRTSRKPRSINYPQRLAVPLSTFLPCRKKRENKKKNSSVLQLTERPKPPQQTLHASYRNLLPKGKKKEKRKEKR